MDSRRLWLEGGLGGGGKGGDMYLTWRLDRLFVYLSLSVRGEE